MPDFLSAEIQDFIKQLYGIDKTDRMFTITKSYNEPANKGLFNIYNKTIRRV